MITDFVNNNSTSPLAVDANFLYANLLFKNKKYRDAIKVYDKIEESDLDDNEISEYQFKKHCVITIPIISMLQSHCFSRHL